MDDEAAWREGEWIRNPARLKWPDNCNSLGSGHGWWGVEGWRGGGEVEGDAQAEVKMGQLRARWPRGSNLLAR